MRVRVIAHFMTGYSNLKCDLGKAANVHAAFEECRLRPVLVENSQ
jgi:hypothetical protein